MKRNVSLVKRVGQGWENRMREISWLIPAFPAIRTIALNVAWFVLKSLDPEFYVFGDVFGFFNPLQSGFQSVVKEKRASSSPCVA